ncbi:MAG: twin-arginine translocase subunit TatC [Planctomycetota bacterium]
MNRFEKPKDDLFDESTMTFGEHLEELRKSVTRALICLGVGLAIGLFFASLAVNYIQSPLRSAIQQFNARRSLAKMGFVHDQMETEEGQQAYDRLERFLADGALVAELVYDLPAGSEDSKTDDAEPSESVSEKSLAGDNQPPALTEDSDVFINAVSASSKTTDAKNSANPVPALEGQRVELSELVAGLPSPSELKPRLQFRRNEKSSSALKMEEPFLIWFKAGLLLGAVIASPGIFYFLWDFVAAGLLAHERRYVYTYLPFSVVLFIGGVTLAFFVVLHYVLGFLLTFNGTLDVGVEPRLTYYVNFVLMLPVGFGIAFQLPLVMLFLERLGIFTGQQYLASWRIAIVVIAVLSMVLTPAEVYSMIALMVPLIGLYFLGVGLCYFMPKGRGLGAAAYDPA